MVMLIDFIIIPETVLFRQVCEFLEPQRIPDPSSVVPLLGHAAKSGRECGDGNVSDKISIVFFQEMKGFKNVRYEP